MKIYVVLQIFKFNHLCDVKFQHAVPDSIIFGDSPKAQPIRELSYSEESPIRNTKTKEKHSMSSSQGNNPHVHSYLFGSDFVSVDTLGNVLILSVPLIPSKEVSHSKCASASSSMLLNCLKQDSCHSGTSQGQHKGQSMQEKAVANLRTSGQARCTMDETLLISKLHYSLGQQEKKLDGVEEIVQTPILKGSLSHEGDTAVETLVANKTPIFLAAESSDDIGDTDLSPRLTNLIKSGIVPESPINESGQYSSSNIDMLLYICKVGGWNVVCVKLSYKGKVHAEKTLDFFFMKKVVLTI